MKSENRHIILGAILLSVVFLLALFPEIVVSEKMHSAKSIMELTEGEYLSFIIYGIRTVATAVILVSAIRTIAAITIGILSGLGSWTFGGLISLFESVFRIIPANIVGLAILVGAFANESLRGQFPAILIAVLSITGWSESAVNISREMKKLRSGMVSKGGEAAGRRHASIFMENMSRILKDRLPSMFFDQSAKVLTIIAQLCIFYGLFEGFGMLSDPVSVIESQDNTAIARLIPYWHLKPWLALYPGFTFFIGIFASNLLSEGFEKRRRRLASDKKAENHLFATGIFLFASVVIVIFFINKSTVVADFSISEIRRSLVFERTGEMIPGSREAVEGAEIIALELEKIGFLPISDSFVQKYERDEVIEPIYDELVFDTGVEKISYEAGKDYFADSYGMFDVSGSVYDGRRMDYYSMEDKYGEFSGKWILLEKREYGQEDIMAFSEKILEQSEAKGVLVSGSETENRYASQGRSLSERPVLTISGKISNPLAEGNGELMYRQIAKTNGTEGINVLAKLEEPKHKKEKTILIGLSYGWQYEPVKSGKIDFGLELAKQLAHRQDELGVNVVLAFFDIAGGSGAEGKAYFSSNLPLQEDDIGLYIDLTKVYGDVSGRVVYGLEAAEGGLDHAVSAGNLVQSALSRNDYPFVYTGISKAEHETLAKEHGIVTLSMGFEPCPDSSMDIEDFGDTIVETILKLGR
ncbi:MAG TPA: hypothetical protein VJ990_10215 [Clostridia bacterium]|nr:hypothetical protein [Clostridia bacterium]